MIDFIKYNSNNSFFFKNRISLLELKKRILNNEKICLYGYYEIAKDNDENEIYLKISLDKVFIENIEELEVYLGRRFRDNWRGGSFERTVTFLNPESKEKIDKISKNYNPRLFSSGKIHKTYSTECIEIYEK